MLAGLRWDSGADPELERVRGGIGQSEVIEEDSLLMLHLLSVGLGACALVAVVSRLPWLSLFPLVEAWSARALSIPKRTGSQRALGLSCFFCATVLS